MTNPQISIIVPVYNTIKYLDRCVQSVLEQNYENFELIIIDDGSEIETASKCDKISQIDSRIKVYHNPNSGQLAARIFGIRKSTGQYIMFLDSDDAYCPNALEVVCSYIRQYQFDCLFFRFQALQEGIVIYKSTVEKNAPHYINDKRKLYEKVFGFVEYNSMCRKVIKRDVAEKANYEEFYHLRMGEDLIQSIGIYQNADQILFVNDVLYNYYINSESVTQSLSWNKIRDSYEVRMATVRFLEGEAVFAEKEYNEYYRTCFEALAKQIIEISKDNMETRSKKELFDKIHSDPYYTFLFKKKKTKVNISTYIVLQLHKAKQYSFLIHLCGIMKKGIALLRRMQEDVRAHLFY